jgi:hypothetical protein
MAANLMGSDTLAWTAFAIVAITFTVIATALAIIWFLYDEAIRGFKTTKSSLDQTNVRLDQLVSELRVTNKRLSEFQEDFRHGLSELRNETRHEGQLQGEFRDTGTDLPPEQRMKVPS